MRYRKNGKHSSFYFFQTKEEAEDWCRKTNKGWHPEDWYAADGEHAYLVFFRYSL